MDVSIIIVNYNTRDLTLQCLSSVFKKTSGLSFEVIVVDNASSDDSVAQIIKYFPQVKLINNSENIGFGRANNLGYEYTSGDYIFLLNSDTILINNAIFILWEFLKKNNHIAIVGGQLYQKDGLKTTISYSHLFPSILMEIDILLRRLISSHIEKNKRKIIKKQGFVQVAYISGADMMLRSSDIQELGFFDSSFFLYFEETELSNRFFRNGRISVFYPEAKIIHLEGSSFSFSKVRSKFYKEGRKNYYRLTHNPIYGFIANTIGHFTDFIIRIMSKIKYLINK